VTSASALILLTLLGTDRPHLLIEGGQFRPLPLAIAPPHAEGDAAAGREIEEVLNTDLAVSGIFQVLDKKSFLADPKEGFAPTAVKWSRWSDVGAEALIKSQVSSSGGSLHAEFHLYTVAASREDLSTVLTGTPAEARRIAHKFADEVFHFYTLEDGAFQTKMAYVRETKRDHRIYVAEWDGYGAKAVTEGGLNLLPSWSRDGSMIGFTSYRAGNPDIYTQSLSGGPARSIVHVGRLATGIVFAPDGKHIAYSLGDDYGAQVYIADLDASSPRALTHGFGINTSPSWSPDGSQIAYVSDSAGSPQVYVIASAGGSPTRITFQGNYNQEPKWSPRGDVIAFTARDERNVFDLFEVDPKTTKIKRLTQDQGNNREPTWAPNGRMLGFTSNRTGGRWQLWVMSADGNTQRQMTFDKEGEIATPAWGPKVP
jgi:TolB protein